MAEFKVPFDSNGNMLHESWGRNIEWRDAIPFLSSLSYDSYTRGRSAMTFYWRDHLGIRYPMFLSDFDKMMKEKFFEYGGVRANWGFVKRGGYYGIKPVPVVLA